MNDSFPHARSGSDLPRDTGQPAQALTRVTARFKDRAFEARFQNAQLFQIRRVMVGFAVVGILGALLSGYGAYVELGIDVWAFQGGSVLRLLLIILASMSIVAFLRLPSQQHLYCWHTAVLILGCLTIALRMSVPYEGAETLLSLFHVSRDGVLLLLLVALYVLLVVPGWFALNVMILTTLLVMFLALAWSSPEGAEKPLRLVLVSIAAFGFILGLANGIRRLWRHYFLAQIRLQEANRQLEQLSLTDDLTGCANRRQLFSRGREEMKKAARYHWPLSVIGVDIDHFKQVNDRYGHAVGDEVLQAFAQTLRAFLREGDLAARVGGEEFVILLPGTERNGALLLAERLREQVEAQPVSTDSGSISVRASFGVADLASVSAKDFSDLLSAADKSLYRAKENGRNRVVSADLSSDGENRFAY